MYPITLIFVTIVLEILIDLKKKKTQRSVQFNKRINKHVHAI